MYLVQWLPLQAQFPLCHSVLLECSGAGGGLVSDIMIELEGGMGYQLQRVMGRCLGRQAQWYQGGWEVDG